MRVEERQQTEEDDDPDFLNLNGLVSGSNLDDMPDNRKGHRPNNMI
jgi:hypothetical protein